MSRVLLARVSVIFLAALSILLVAAASSGLRAVYPNDNWIETATLYDDPLVSIDVDAVYRTSFGRAVDTTMRLKVEGDTIDEQVYLADVGSKSGSLTGSWIDDGMFTPALFPVDMTEQINADAPQSVDSVMLVLPVEQSAYLHRRGVRNFFNGGQEYFEAKVRFFYQNNSDETRNVTVFAAYPETDSWFAVQASDIVPIQVPANSSGYRTVKQLVAEEWERKDFSTRIVMWTDAGGINNPLSEQTVPGYEPPPIIDWSRMAGLIP